MVSPQLLRRFPFFGGLTESQLREISMISEEEVFEKGGIILTEKNAAEKLYLLMDGSIDLFFLTVDEINPNPPPPKQLMAGEINPGEIFGIGALIKPYMYSATARAATRCQVLGISALALRELIDKDADMADKLLKQTVHALMGRLTATRVLLAAAQS